MAKSISYDYNPADGIPEWCPLNSMADLKDMEVIKDRLDALEVDVKNLKWRTGTLHD